MIEFLIKHFVKNPEDYSDPDTRTAYGSMAGGVGIVLNLILSTFKISIGLMTGSIAILGQTPDKALSKKIKRLVIRPECVYSVYQLIIHDYGANSIYATICANVDNRYSLEEISTVLDSLEAKAQKELNVNLTIRANPIDINDPLLTGTIDALIEICLDVDALINVHNIHIVHDKDQDIARYEVVKKYKANLTDDEIKSILAARLAEKIPGIKSEVSVVTMYF